ncbi:MAG: putative rane protein [Oscillospiraceae bacterium]|nr:putative rane protein [Oscillospiraceae bacterium]
MADKINTRYICLIGILLGMAVVLSIFENFIPPIPTMPPGIKLGLSNIITMYVLFFLGKRSAFIIVLIKSGFVLISKGFIASVLSLSGGIFSTLIMVLLLLIKIRKPSYLMISIAGAVSHNFAQLFVASLITGTGLILFYFPLLIFSGIVMGSVTGVILKTLLPAMEKLKIVIHKNG